MGNYDEFYEKVFGDIEIGDRVRIYKEGTMYEGELIFKNKSYITVQLPYYREGFSIPEFFTGHSRLCAEGEEIELEAEIDDEDISEEDIDLDEEE